MSDLRLALLHAFTARLRMRLEIHESIDNASTLFAREKIVKASFLRIPRAFARGALEEASPEREIFAVTLACGRRGRRFQHSRPRKRAGPRKSGRCGWVWISG
jgi:hypothetical protein